MTYTSKGAALISRVVNEAIANGSPVIAGQRGDDGAIYTMAGCGRDDLCIYGERAMVSPADYHTTVAAICAANPVAVGVVVYRNEWRGGVQEHDWIPCHRENAPMGD